jgi:hypothetical protein
VIEPFTQSSERTLIPYIYRKRPDTSRTWTLKIKCGRTISVGPTQWCVGYIDGHVQMTVVNDMAETATRQSPLTKTNLKVWVEGPVSTIRDFQKWLRDGFYKEMSNGAQKVAREAALHAVTRNDDDASTFVDFFDLRSDAETVTATLRQRFPALKFPSGSVA